MKTGRKLHYFYFVPHREQHNYCDEKGRSAMLIHVC